MSVVTRYRDVRGFNYNPSYASTLYEMWDRFDPAVWRTELARGKEYFPAFNCARVWMDFNPYLRDPKRFVTNLAAVLDICGQLNIQLMPTLFNRWHDWTNDYTGVYVDQFLNQKYRMFDPYLKAVVSPFTKDQRILMWDLCNEPQMFNHQSEIEKSEIGWLEHSASELRALGVSQPITVGTMTGRNVELAEPFCDVICFHPYPGWWDNSFAQLCDDAVKLATAKNKPLIANETCQGSLDNTVRATIIQNSLAALKSRGIGWCAWQLHGGRMLSANRTFMDANCRPGDQSYMAFIEPDGTRRPGSEAFNEF